MKSKKELSMFKKKYLVLILALVLAVLPLQVYSSSLKTIMLQINSRTAYVNMEAVPLDAAPMISNGRTMVPLRFIAEHFGARDITFQAETKTVLIELEDPQSLRDENSQLRTENEALKNRIEELEGSGSDGTMEEFSVCSVIDGDTIELCNGERVRYLGIDAPESNMPYHAEALAYNQNLVMGKKVRLEYDVQKRDAFGRLLAYVWLEDRMVNREILLAGLAILYTLPPNVKYAEIFFEDMKTAQSTFMGIWAELKDRVKISFVNYDAEGDDRSNLNGEWVEIRNGTTLDLDMTGFILTDDSQHEFVFPAFILGAGKSVRVHSGSGEASADALFWGSGMPIWNNDHDVAYLYDSNRTLLDKWSY
jgi:micrococcal nuclease